MLSTLTRFLTFHLWEITFDLCQLSSDFHFDHCIKHSFSNFVAARGMFLKHILFSSDSADSLCGELQ